MSSPNILISGSGIAGSVFAFWMLRAYRNANITIVERAPALRLTGASVDLRSSAVDIMKWMGLEQKIRDASTKEKGISWVNSKGSPIATMYASGVEDMQTITSEFEIFRGALAKIFIEPSMDKVNLIFNDYVEKYEQETDGVTVTFAKSKEVKKYDLLVAADGFGSKIRGQMLGTNPREQIHDEGIHVAYFTIKEDLLDGSQIAQWYNTTRGRVVFLRPDPAGYTRGHFMNVRLLSDTAAKKRFDDAVDQGHEAYMTLLEEDFKDAGWITPQVLKAMRASDDFYCSLFAQVRSPILQQGRVVLLGDAGYATPGIGTSLAIMGAYTLAGELLREPSDYALALKRYEDLMIPFGKLMQGDDNMMQYFNPQTEWGLGIRNVILRVALALKLDWIAMRVGAWFGMGEKKMEFPEYPWPQHDDEEVIKGEKIDA